MFGAQFVVNIVNFFVGVAEVLLGFRVVLKLLAANAATPFVNWIYDTSEPLLVPFRGMFPSPQLATGSELEFSALFALMIYAFVGYLLVELVAVVESGAKSRRKK